MQKLGRFYTLKMFMVCIFALVCIGTGHHVEASITGQTAQFQENAQNTGVSKYSGPTLGVREKWTKPITLGESDPMVGAGGTVYAVSTVGVLYAVNPDGTDK